MISSVPMDSQKALRFGICGKNCMRQNELDYALGVLLWKQRKYDAAASAFDQGLAVRPKDLSLLSNDAELALGQRDKARFQNRIAAALPQVTPKDPLYVILQFLTWLANPTLSRKEDLMKAISELAPGVEFVWDFSDTVHVLERLDLDASTKQTAQHFIDFFKNQIDLPTLKRHLAE
jgi:hypothetical protein